jgi:O-methyltransferase
LPVSKLARRSIFILACVLADPAIAGPFAPEASCPAVASSSRSGYFRLEQQLPGGLSSSHWKSAFFHGALGIWVAVIACLWLRMQMSNAVVNSSLLDESEQPPLATRFANVTFADCYPYHWFDLPSGQIVVGSWDLRRNWRAYLGGVNFAGMRVFEPGPASGYLTMQMETMGADVVTFDLPPGTPPDLLPLPGRDMAEVALEAAARIDRVRNSWWYFKRALGWRAKAVYGDIYNLPNYLGRFDVTVMAAILLHLANPFRAIQQIASVTDKIICITDLLNREFADRAYMEFSPHPESGDPMTWWYISPHAVGRMLRAAGFENIRMTSHKHNHHPSLAADSFSTLEFYTLVAER